MATSWRNIAQRLVPQEWQRAVDFAREEIAWTLQTLSLNALELSRLWIDGNFDSRLLCDVMSIDFADAQPMSAAEFRNF